MTDIVERIASRIHDAPMPTEYLLDEAAAEIERLRAQVNAAREFVKRHPALTLIDLAEFEVFLKVMDAIAPRVSRAASDALGRGLPVTGSRDGRRIRVSPDGTVEDLGPVRDDA